MFPYSTRREEKRTEKAPGERRDQESKKPEKKFSGFFERMAATYSRGIYKTTTIGNTVFDGRVRNGNGSDHSFMATKMRVHEPPRAAARLVEPECSPATCTSILKNVRNEIRGFSENCTQELFGHITRSRVLNRNSSFEAADRSPPLRKKKKRSSRTTD